MYVEEFLCWLLSVFTIAFGVALGIYGVNEVLLW